jgi:hypothetical protein
VKEMRQRKEQMNYLTGYSKLITRAGKITYMSQILMICSLNKQLNPLQTVCLPIIQKKPHPSYVFEDIVVGIFPKVSAQVLDMVGHWAKNSVGDMLEMVMQMLEVHAACTP